MKSQLLEKTLMLERLRAEDKGVTEDKMVGWPHQLNGHEFEQTLGDGKGQGGLACCSSWRCKELDIVTEKQQASKWSKSHMCI